MYMSAVNFKYFVFFAGRFIAKYRANGSSSNVSVAPNTFFGHIILLFLISYDYEKIASVSLSGPSQRTLKKMYIQKSFPFVSTRRRLGKSYKVFFLGLCWVSKNIEYDININGADGSPLCCALKVVGSDMQANFGYKDFSTRDILNQVAQSLRSPVEIRTELLMPYIAALLGQRRRSKADNFHLVILLSATLHNFYFVRDIVRKIKNDFGNSQRQFYLDQISETLHPMILGPHGYSKRLSTLTDNELGESMESLLNFFRKEGYLAFINSGTLLGSVREGDLIDHDDDLDLAIFLVGDTLEEISESWTNLRLALAQNFTVKMKNCFAAVYTDTGVQIDVFPAWSVAEKLFIYPYCYGEIDVVEVFPLSSSKLRTLDFPAPSNPEKLLEINYGPSWKTSDPDWRFDWKLSAKRFRKERSSLVFKGGSVD